MALRALMAKRKIDKLTETLAALEAKAEELKTRESELETAIAEADTEEEQAAVSEEVTAHETATAENNAAIEEARAAIEAAKAELAEIEKNTPAPAAPAPENTRKEVNTMPIMIRRYTDYTMEERSAFVAREEVRSWLGQMRDIIKTRGVSGTNVIIPTTVLPLIHAETEKNSKLLAHVRTRAIPGKTRQPIVGAAPEGIWTEMCGKINEGSIGFTDIEIDGFKVGTFIPVCNALLEDNDVGLAGELISMMGEGLGYALDKAIVFGTGTKMPTGMASGITVKTALGGATGLNLFKAIIRATKGLKHKRDGLVWIMNEATRLDILAEAVGSNAGAAIVSGMGGTMPVVGGAIVEEDFVKDGEIIVGYGERYLLVRRAGMEVAESKECRFVEDQTVFKATARYDGKPVFADAFIALALGSNAPTGTLDPNHPFVTDTANTANAANTPGESH